MAVRGELDANKKTQSVAVHAAMCGFDSTIEFMGAVGAFQGLRSGLVTEAISKFMRSRQFSTDTPDFVRSWMGEFTPGQSHRLLCKRTPAVGFDTTQLAVPVS